jgi:hypothetical protein
MSTHHAQAPARVRDYFTSVHVDMDDHENHPIITQVFTPGKGWQPHPTRKHVSFSWLVTLRNQGVTSVVLSAEGHDADFSLDELVGRMRKLDAEFNDAPDTTRWDDRTPSTSGPGVRTGWDSGAVQAILR